MRGSEVSYLQEQHHTVCLFKAKMPYLTVLCVSREEKIYAEENKTRPLPTEASLQLTIPAISFLCVVICLLYDVI